MHTFNERTEYHNTEFQVIFIDFFITGVLESGFFVGIFLSLLSRHNIVYDI